MRLAIVGGGIAGLAAAHHAVRAAASSGGPVPEIVVVEQADRWGGKLTTERVPVPGAADARFVVEGGPDTFVATKPGGVTLCDELGMADRLRGADPDTATTWILRRGRLHELPGGLTMMIPTEIRPMLRTGLLSWPAKARLGLDLLLPAARGEADETLGRFVTRRLGRSAYENLVEPLMSGIYAGDGDRLSLLATLPHLRDLERRHGGLVKGALALRRERIRAAGPTGAGPAPGGRSMFLTPVTGLAELVEHLVAELLDAGVDLRSGTAVTGLTPVCTPGGGWSLDLDPGGRLDVDAVILATPTFVSGRLLASAAPDLAAELDAVEYVSTATVSVAYHQSDLPRPLDGHGYVIPRKEGRAALACTWTSSKFPHRAPDGYALVRVFLGRAGQDDHVSADEAALAALAREELATTLGITAEPVLTRVFRWDRAMPQYNLGHPERIDRIESLVADLPGLALAGAGYRGVGIPDCITSGRRAAARLLREAGLPIGAQEEQPAPAP